MNLVMELSIASQPHVAQPDEQGMRSECHRQHRMARRRLSSVEEPPDGDRYKDSGLASAWKEWLRSGAGMRGELPEFARFCEVQLIADQLRRASVLVSDALVRALLRLTALCCENMRCAEDFPPDFQGPYLELATKVSVGIFYSQLVAIKRETLS